MVDSDAHHVFFYAYLSVKLFVFHIKKQQNICTINIKTVFLPRT